MKRPKKITVAADRVAVYVATATLMLIGIGLTVMGYWLGSGFLGQAGLIALLPALAQLALFLPVINPPVLPEPEPETPPKKVKSAMARYRMANWYHRSRSVLVSILTGMCILAAHVVFWKYLPTETGNLSWLVPVVLAVVFVVGIALDKWCAHARNNADSVCKAKLQSLRSGILLLQVAVLLALVTSALKLIGLFDAGAIVRVLLSVVMVYGTAVLAFCVAVRLIRKEMDTAPELLVNLIGMGADINILTYLEQNTGITMRSLWSLRLIKQILPGAILGIALLCWLSSCLCQIEAHQEGALFRLGKLQDHTLQPGFHVTLPWPFDQVDIYDTRSINRVSIGYISTGDQDNIWTEDHGGEEYLLLLGDGNEMVSINLQVEYRIEDLLSYIRTSASPEALLQAQAYEIITARTIATDLDSLLAADRESFSETFRQELAQRIAPYGAGLQVVNVVLESIHPPVDIADVYQDIISAGIDAEYMRINAQAQANTKIKNAEKEKTQTVSNALSAKYEQVAAAQASVTEFMAAAAADQAYRDEYRFYKYINAITDTYSGATMILCGDGVDTSRLVISGFKEEVEPEVTEPPYPEEEFEEEYIEYEDYEQTDEAGY